MASGRGSSQDPPLTEIERLRNETIAANQEKLKSLLPHLYDPKPAAKKKSKVAVKVVMKRDAVLPRPYVGVEIMADAKNLGIAWPYNWLKLCKKSKSSQSGEAAGHVQPGEPSLQK